MAWRHEIGFCHFTVSRHNSQCFSCRRDIVSRNSQTNEIPWHGTMPWDFVILLFLDTIQLCLETVKRTKSMIHISSVGADKKLTASHCGADNFLSAPHVVRIYKGVPINMYRAHCNVKCSQL